jgi:hypothetical protein
MNKLLVGAMSAAMLATVSGVAYADDSAYPNNYSPNEYHPDTSVQAPEHVPFKVGAVWSIGIPSGMELGAEVRLPHMPWYKLQVAATYTLAPGMVGSVLIDPIKFPVAPVLNVDVGRQFPFTVPVNGRPGGDFDYATFGGGLAFGSRDGARLLLLAGESYISGSSHNIQAVFGDSNGLTIANPTFKGWIPTCKLGVEFLF